MIDIILPVHNIGFNRDITRLKWSVYSLNNQTVKCNVVIACSSKPREKKLLRRLLNGLDYQWVDVQDNVLNMPNLHKKGMEATEGEYVGTTGADFIFHHTCLENFMNTVSPGVLCLKQVRPFPKMTINKDILDKWHFPEKKEQVRQLRKQGERYTWGLLDNGLLNKIANGGLQFANRSFFESICPPPLHMIKLGAYDNWVERCAEKNDMEVRWVRGSEIGHIFHKISPLKYDPQFDKNVSFVEHYSSDGSDL